MLTTYLIPILLLPWFDAKILLNDNNSKNLVSCVSSIISNYYKRNRITYMNVNYDTNEIIKIINASPVTVISRDTERNLRTSNFQYIIAVGTATDFVKHFPILVEESHWNPYALFFIIVKSLDITDLKSMFDVLLKYHVNDVLVLNGTEDGDLYTYNPFDNYNCGKTYDKVIEFGQCRAPHVKNLFPLKLVTGLQNCTFNATLSHWPPYTIDQTVSKSTAIGAEQYILQLISEMEHFNVTYTKSISGEDFSTINDNMTVSGDLFMLQEKQTDIMYGGMFLMYFRAAAFDSLNGHLPYMDNVRVYVKKAGLVPSWKNIFLEFQTTVWVVLCISFLSYFMLVVALFRVNDRTSLVLIMIDFLFLHGNKVIFKSKGIFIFWIFFAYLISTFYQSSLVSIMANPNKEYQISSDEDLIYYKVEPCICLGLQTYLNVLHKEPGEPISKPGCIKMLDSLHSASKSNKKYAIAMDSKYLYHRHLFHDERWEDSIYSFKRPVSSVIYAIYLYKGFPRHNILNAYTIRFREHGFVDRYIVLLYEERLRKLAKTVTRMSEQKQHFIFPWYILTVGSAIACGIFLLELLSKKNPKTIHITY